MASFALSQTAARPVSAKATAPTKARALSSRACVARKAPLLAASLKTQRAARALAVSVRAEEDAEATPEPISMGIEEIMAVLPHRFPFLMVDRITELIPGVSAKGYKNVTINDQFFPGHFPTRPLMPGVLQVEAMAQVGGLILLPPGGEGGTDKIFFFGGVDKVKWRKPVVPGDKLEMEVTLTKLQKRFGIAKMSGKAYVDGKVQQLKASLVITDSAGEQWLKMVQAATSFSCSVGPALPKILGPLLLQLPEQPDELQPICFCCENDHNAVMKLQEMLRGRVAVVPCMVDRICSDRQIKSSSMSVFTEPWEGIIIPLSPVSELCNVDLDECILPLGGESVFMPRTQEIADYRYERKLYFVNHMHTTLALMTLARYRQSKNLSAEELLDAEGACIPLPLARPSAVSDSQKFELKAWMVAQILMLGAKFDTEVMLEAHGLQTKEELYRSLVEVATSRVDRFSTVQDTCDRVLGAGVACRFEGRLLPAYDVVVDLRRNCASWPDDCPEKRVLKAAGMSIHDVYWALTCLVSEGREIEDADLVKRYGPGEEEQDKGRQDWLARGMHTLRLDWLACAMGLAQGGSEDDIHLPGQN